MLKIPERDYMANFHARICQLHDFHSS